jgi:hypothetical protein
VEWFKKEKQLPSKHEALHSKPTATKKKKERERERILLLKMPGVVPSI